MVGIFVINVSIITYYIWRFFYVEIMLIHLNKLAVMLTTFFENTVDHVYNYDVWNCLIDFTILFCI